MTRARFRRIGWLVAVLWGCGAKSSETYVCAPACPTGLHCGAGGCEPDQPAPVPDATVPDAAAGCPAPCVGATPYCRDDHQCVACLTDEHCPPGFTCHPLGAAAACVPGCTVDAHCQGDGGAPLRCCARQCVDTTTDPGNCGGCGTSCVTLHAGASCVASSCAPGACEAGWADCNHDAADGCETNLRTDPLSCGACGTACALPNAAAGCAGTCYLLACNHGWDDCNGDALDGCETAVRSDPHNCGACGATCATEPHARSACIDTLCQLVACDAGHADCDGLADTGCEVTVASDVNNCGYCGNACGKGLVCKNGGCTCPQCDFPNARSACVNLVCALVQCLPGWGDCNGITKDGCEHDVTADLNNCGGCGHACSHANITPSCVGGACTGACNKGFADCNKNLLADGCECDLSINVCTKAGACLKRSGQPCVQGNECGSGTCCAGACADLSNDSSNCGACGMVCPGMTPYCAAGKCGTNPCTGQVGGDVAAVMGTPLYGFCWYLGVGGATCDTVCNETGGTNEAIAADASFPDDCMAMAPDGQVSVWFQQNANACSWDPNLYVATGYHTLGQGYTVADMGGRVGRYVGKCGMGLTNSGTYPGDSNDSVALGSGRCVVCACSN
jgi:hypothetical protein